MLLMQRTAVVPSSIFFSCLRIFRNLLLIALIFGFNNFAVAISCDSWASLQCIQHIDDGKYSNQTECITDYSSMCNIPTIDVPGSRTGEPWEWSLPFFDPNFYQDLNIPGSGGGASSDLKEDVREEPETCYPVTIASGNKVLHEEDYSGSGEFPLSIGREYTRQTASRGLFGSQWESPLDAKLVFGFSDIGRCEYVPGEPWSAACESASVNLLYLDY